MEQAVVLERLLAGGAIALTLAGAASALMASNAIKRLIGVTLAGLGVVAAMAVWTPHAVFAATAIMFAHIAVGVAITVRLQESYGTVEARDIDAADANDEPRERGQ
ncbi:MAG: hypothetical protein AB7T59_10810 [Hyphomonadaceae bacterium]